MSYERDDVEDVAYREFQHRMAPGEAALRASGEWLHLHAWLNVTQDRAIPPAAQRFMAERANARIEEVAASHASMVSQPEVATRLILSAVEATSRSRP